MLPSNSPCDRLRASLAARLHEPRPGEETTHLETCTECRAWLERRRSAAESLRSLPRLVAPVELFERVRAEIGRVEANALEDFGSDPRLATALRELSRRPVPAALDDRVFDGCRADTTPLARTLRQLHRLRAPRVLERLVDEELKSPAAHRVRRFAGDLARLSAPSDLEERVRRVQERRASRLPFAVVSLTGLVAAALVLWITRPTIVDGRTNETAYRFRVVRASSISELSPYAQWFAKGLTGGALDAGEEEAR